MLKLFVRCVPLPKPALKPYKLFHAKKLHEIVTAHSSSDEGWRWLVQLSPRYNHAVSERHGPDPRRSVCESHPSSDPFSKVPQFLIKGI